MRNTDLGDELNRLTERVIGAAIEVHRHLGPGLLESAYEECLCRELSLTGLSFQRQLELPVEYKGARLDCGYRLDVVVERRLVLELKSVEALLPVHEAQTITYLKLTNLRAGLLINFNVPILKNGIRRFVNTPSSSAAFAASR
jgi:GxxExxY protein